MSYLLDTNICVALLKGKDSKLVARVKAESPDKIFLSSVVRAELLYGARKSAKVAANLSALEQFFPHFRSLPFDDRAAEFYGLARATLEAAGAPIGANDLLISSIAQAHDLTLVTRNRDEFARVPSLRWETW